MIGMMIVHRRLRSGAAMIAALVASAHPFAALAQSSGQSGKVAVVAAEDGEIVVTGFRAQNRLAIDAKRQSEIIADFLKSDDIGQQPDYNIADSFRRLPGVQTVFDEDEGRYIAVRGLNPSYTIGSLDGGTMATAERGNRQLNLEAIPSTAVSSLEVLKSRTPDIEGNAIGGSINLVTRSAFDKPGLFLFGSALLGISDSQAVPGRGFGRNSDNGPNVRADLTLSTRFGPDDMFGIMVSGSFSRKRRDQERLLPQSVPVTTTATPAPAGAGTNLLWSTYPNSVDRYGGTVKLEARPAPGVEAFVAYTYFAQDDQELRHSLQLLNTSGGSFVRFNDFPIRKPLHYGQAGLRWDGDSGHHLALRGSWSEATFLEPSNELVFNLIAPAATFDLALDGVNPALSNVTPRIANPAEYRFTQYRPYEDDSTDTVKEAQLDYGWNNQRGDDGIGFGSGAKFRRTTRDNGRTQTFFNPATGVDLRLTPFDQGVQYQPILANFNQIFIDFQKFQDFFTANPNSFTRDAVNTDRQSIGGDWRFQEDVGAGYALLRHHGPRHNFIAGVRYENTSVATKGIQRRTTAGVDRFTPVARADRYDDWLLSATGYYDLATGVRLRGAFFQAVGRPNPNQVAGQELINADESISRSNPDLAPRRADSIEAALEYYLPEDLGILSVGSFKKWVRGEIYTFSANEVVDGVNRVVNQPRNAEGATIAGLEANVVLNRLAFLPGPLADFGISGNITVLEGRITVTNGTVRRALDELPGQASFLANAAVFYESGGVRARLTYSHVGRFRSTVNAATPASDQTTAPYNQLDFQARLKLGRQVEIIAEARNLTNAARLVLTGPNQDIARDINRFGRQFWLGAAFTM